MLCQRRVEDLIFFSSTFHNLQITQIGFTQQMLFLPSNFVFLKTVYRIKPSYCYSYSILPSGKMYYGSIILTLYTDRFFFIILFLATSHVLSSNLSCGPVQTFCGILFGKNRSKLWPNGLSYALSGIRRATRVKGTNSWDLFLYRSALT